MNSNFCLRDLPLPTRIVIGTFLIAIGLGYFSALVQLHFQHASPGNLMPTADDAVRAYHGAVGGETMSHIERVLTTDPAQAPFNGTGSMKPAFFEKSERKWEEKLNAMKPEEKEHLLKCRNGECEALVHWVKAGGPRSDYDKDEHVLPGDLVLSDDYVVKKENGKITVAIQKLFSDRCVRCHMENGADKHAASYPLDEYDKLKKYLEVKTATAMDITKLAQTTHVHLLGFCMMFGLTGTIFSLTAYPVKLRAVLAPWPLVFQVLDISCWWLGRLDPTFAKMILVTGGLVGMGLAIHILGSLGHLTGLTRRWEARPQVDQFS